jgi:hypothetical protein
MAPPVRRFGDSMLVKRPLRSDEQTTPRMMEPQPGMTAAGVDIAQGPEDRSIRAAVARVRLGTPIVRSQRPRALASRPLNRRTREHAGRLARRDDREGLDGRASTRGSGPGVRARVREPNARARPSKSSCRWRICEYSGFESNSARTSDIWRRLSPGIFTRD